MNKIKFIVVLLVVITAAMGSFLFFKKKDNKKYNILIISLCSTKKSHLIPYGYSKDTTPNLNKIFNTSVVFDNVVSTKAWSTVHKSLSRISIEKFKDNDYRLIGREWESLDSKNKKAPFFIRVSPQKEWHIWGMNLLKNTLQKEVSRKKDGSPFLMAVHFNFPHFPYTNFLNSNEHINFDHKKFLSKSQIKLLDKYVNNPKKYPDKLPLFILLFRNADMVNNNKYIRSIQKKYFIVTTEKRPFGIVNNPILLEKWKNSKGYEEDLELLVSLFDSKLFAFDKLIKSTLDTYETSLKDNTILIFTTDHGVSFMDHGQLHAGTTTYNEELSVALFVKFPGQKKGIRIKKQIKQETITDMVLKLLSNDVSLTDISKYIETIKEDDYIFSKNCSKSQFAVSYKGEWKFIKDFMSGEKLLFDLQKDPAEKFNVIDEEPEMALLLEEKFMENYTNSKVYGHDFNCGNSEE